MIESDRAPTSIPSRGRETPDRPRRTSGASGGFRLTRSPCAGQLGPGPCSLRGSGRRPLSLDPDSEQLLDVSAAALRLTGFEREPLLRMPASYLFRYEAKGGKERLRAAAQKSGVHHPQEGYLLRTNRDGVWVPVSLSVSRLHVRPRTLALFTARDVRERREADRQLKRVEQELARVTAAIAACLWSAEVDGSGRWVYKYWSAAVEKITGRPADFFFPGPASGQRSVHPEDRSTWRETLSRPRGSERGQAEYRIVWPDGLVRRCAKASPCRRARAAACASMPSSATSPNAAPPRRPPAKRPSLPPASSRPATPFRPRRARPFP